MAWNTRYPIGQLIAAAARGAELTVNDLLTGAGYRNLNKGRRRLEQLLASGQTPEEFSEALRRFLAIETELWAAALSATLEQIAAEQEATQRERFRPYIYVETRGGLRTAPVFIKAFTAGQKLLPVSAEWLELSTKELVGHVSKLVARHFQDKGGEFPVHGTITGYRLHITYDHAVDLGTDGSLLKPLADPTQESLPILWEKRREMAWSRCSTRFVHPIRTPR